MAQGLQLGSAQQRQKIPRRVKTEELPALEIIRGWSCSPFFSGVDRTFHISLQGTTSQWPGPKLLKQYNYDVMALTRRYLRAECQRGGNVNMA